MMTFNSLTLAQDDVLVAVDSLVVERSVPGPTRFQEEHGRLRDGLLLPDTVVFRARGVRTDVTQLPANCGRRHKQNPKGLL